MPRVVGQKIGVDRGRDVYAPIVIVTVAPAGCIATRPAMIDSGADSTIVPFEALQGCPVDWASLVDAGPGRGAGGSFETRLLTARVKYREWVVADEVKVAAPGSGLPLILLGRSDFFAKFIVKFRWDAAPPFVDVDPVGNRR